MIEENWDDPNSTAAEVPYSTSHNEEVNFGREKGIKYDSYSKKLYNNENKKEFSRNNKGDKWKGKREIKDFDSNFHNLIMQVETNKIGKIIGKQGSKIKELQEKTGVKIKIGDPCGSDSYKTNVIINGNEECQKNCQKLIEELLNSNHLFQNKTDFSNDKPIPVIDWDKVNELAEKAEKAKWEKCPPLKKNFYIEDPEIANMTKEEVKTFRENNKNIVVKHIFENDEKISNPVKTFAQAFQHYPDILNEIEKQGFKFPSPIQCQAWPIIMSGKDLIGIAQTGTGKTLAFLLPALIHIDGQEVPRSERGGANVLIIAPTRELALQIEKEVQKYSYKNIKSVCVYGGGNRREQMNIVTSGVEIIIATPGRLNDLVESGVINLSSVTYLVLDEADRMLDMGFEPQIRKVLLDIRPDRQSIMTSATWPENVRNLAERYMSNPVQVYIGSLDLAAVHSVTQTIWIVEEEDKKDYLYDFIRSLSKDDKVIVFVGKKVVADDLSCDLSLDKILCQCIHGDREQIDREQALEDLKTGAVKILIATDVASRGLDIGDVTKVLNYDFPKNIEEYVHRVGRTGRAGKKGEAVTFFTRSDWAYAGDLITIMERANQAVPDELYFMRNRFQNMIERKEEEKSLGKVSSGYGSRGKSGRFRGFKTENQYH